MNSICSVLVLSCDRYQEAWHPFFALLEKYWTDCPFPIKLCTETLTFNEERPTVETIQTGSKAWSDRLLDALQRIDSNFVILLLDDFFIMHPVKQSKINQVLQIMRDNPDIAVFYFKHSTGQTVTESVYNDYVRMEYNKKYIINFQAALWSKSALLALIQPGMTPWEIEETPPTRHTEQYQFYCSKYSSYTNCDDDVFPYLWALQAGYGICKSKWLWNNRKLFKYEGIEVDFHNLGKYSKIVYLFNKSKQRIISKLCRKETE